jgi:hypothetical protein
METKLVPSAFECKISSLYFAEDWVDSWYDHTNDVIVTTWFNLSTKVHYRKSYQVQLEAAKKYGPKALIIDTSRAFGVPHPEDHKWLVNTVFPEAKKLNLQFIINIFPRNSIAKTGVKTVIDSGKKHEFNILQMPTLDDAYSFLKSN